MRAIINGSYSNVVWAKGSNQTANILLMNDNASVLDLTGGSVDLVVYDRADRANTAIATHVTDTLTTPAAGLATLAIDDTELTYGPGEYYIFVRHTTSGGLVYYATPYVLSIV